MTARRAPVARKVSDTPVVPAHSTSSKLALSRVITRAEHGSDILFGTCRLEFGETSAPFSLTSSEGRMAEQEVYYVIAGEIELEWEDGALTAGADTAVYLAPGYTYVLRGASESAMVVYVYVPAPV